MKPMTATVMAAFLTGSLAFSAVAPTFAQPAAPSPSAPPAAEAPGKPDQRPHRGGPRGGDHMNRGAWGLDQMLDRLADRITLTEDQTKLFDDLKAASAEAGTEFKAAVDDLRPTPPAPPPPPTPSPEGANPPPPQPPAPDFIQRFEANLALSKANVAAMEAIKPAYDAFFSSLTDEQKAQLNERGPRDRGERGDRRDRGNHRPDPRGNHDPAQHDNTDADHSQHEGASDEEN